MSINRKDPMPVLNTTKVDCKAFLLKCITSQVKSCSFTVEVQTRTGEWAKQKIRGCSFGVESSKVDSQFPTSLKK